MVWGFLAELPSPTLCLPLVLALLRQPGEVFQPLLWGCLAPANASLRSGCQDGTLTEPALQCHAALPQYQKGHLRSKAPDEKKPK